MQHVLRTSSGFDAELACHLIFNCIHSKLKTNLTDNEHGKTNIYDQRHTQIHKQHNKYKDINLHFYQNRCWGVILLSRNRRCIPVYRQDDNICLSAENGYGVRKKPYCRNTLTSTQAVNVCLQYHLSEMDWINGWTPDNGFFLACEDLGKMFDKLFPACLCCVCVFVFFSP